MDMFTSLIYFLQKNEYEALERCEFHEVDGSFAGYAVVTPLRKAASYEPRIAILGI